MTGTLVDEPEDWSKVNRLGKWYKPWFYTVRKIIIKALIDVIISTSNNF